MRTSCPPLQEEGKKLKKFAEKRMKDGRPTHISSMFLCQVCLGVWRLALAVLVGLHGCLCVVAYTAVMTAGWHAAHAAMGGHTEKRPRLAPAPLCRAASSS